MKYNEMIQKKKTNSLSLDMVKYRYYYYVFNLIVF